MGQVSSESLDDILGAVRETPRGREFLVQYEARLRSQETAKILGAIEKLENHIKFASADPHDSETLNRARAALVAARNDIAAMEVNAEFNSTEAQLFANLSLSAKKIFSQSAVTDPGVARALDLVRELDATLMAASPFSEVAKPREHLFRQDMAIFEPAPAQPVVLPAQAQPQMKDVSPDRSKGAKLFIYRGKIEETVAEEVSIAETHHNQALQADLPSLSPISAGEPLNLDKGRIVIIRRKADELEDVPMPGISSDNQYAPFEPQATGT